MKILKMKMLNTVHLTLITSDNSPFLPHARRSFIQRNLSMDLTDTHSFHSDLLDN